MVRGAVKLQEARASHVRCTCSMQGLKAQKMPSGRRHASADLTTCIVKTVSVTRHDNRSPHLRGWQQRCGRISFHGRRASCASAVERCEGTGAAMPYSLPL